MLWIFLLLSIIYCGFEFLNYSFAFCGSLCSVRLIDRSKVSFTKDFVRLRKYWKRLKGTRLPQANMGHTPDPPEAANYTGLKKIFNAETFRGRANVSLSYIIHK